MTTMTEREDTARLPAAAKPDPLRSAFAQAIGALMAGLQPGIERDVAVAEIMEAHDRTVAALAHRRRLH
jgi:hypothetical protein